MFNILGAYVPLTLEGNIIVDGVLASCYASADHDMLHYGMAPLRWFPGMTEWMFGEDDGISGYVKITGHLAQWIMVPDGFVFEEAHFL